MKITPAMIEAARGADPALADLSDQVIRAALKAALDAAPGAKPTPDLIDRPFSRDTAKRRHPAHRRPGDATQATTMSNEFRDIASAPRDGTLIEVRHGSTQEIVRGTSSPGTHSGISSGIGCF
jgi:hypothetical protein